VDAICCKFMQEYQHPTKSSGAATVDISRVSLLAAVPEQPNQAPWSHDSASTFTALRMPTLLPQLRMSTLMPQLRMPTMAMGFPPHPVQFL